MCEHCGYKGHTKETYYRIVEFSADFKSKRKVENDTYKKPQANNTTFKREGNIEKQSSTTSETERELNFPRGYFTKDQYK